MLKLISHVTMHVNCGGSVRSEEKLSTDSGRDSMPGERTYTWTRDAEYTTTYKYYLNLNIYHFLLFNIFLAFIDCR